MITIKEAVVAAKQFIRDLYADAGEDISEIGLEEVDRTEDDHYWLITVGFMAPEREKTKSALDEKFRMAGFNPLAASTLVRQYRVVEVDTETGQVRAMKIRDI